MAKVLDTISLLRAVILDENCSRMNPSTVKGYLGELLVKSRLEGEGVLVEHLGNQSGYDLQFKARGRLIAIDVKFSALKSDDGKGENWGWALQHDNKKRGLSCTHVVCVAASKDLEVLNTYVVARHDVESFPNAPGRFGRVKHGFVIPAGNAALAGDCERGSGAGWGPMYEGSSALLESRKAILVSNDCRLSDVLLDTWQPNQPAAPPNKVIRSARQRTRG